MCLSVGAQTECEPEINATERAEDDEPFMGGGGEAAGRQAGRRKVQSQEEAEPAQS